MKVFLSWSGNQSRALAVALRSWLPDVIQSIQPWMSEKDIQAGTRWSFEVQRQLTETRFGILCVTPGNLTAPWLLFEAGALAKTIDETYVCPYLAGLSPQDLPLGPLTQFQAKIATKDGTRDLIGAINSALGETSIESERVDRSFERCWPELEKAIERLPRETESKAKTKTSNEFLREILLLARDIDRKVSEPKRPAVRDQDPPLSNRDRLAAKIARSRLSRPGGHTREDRTSES